MDATRERRRPGLAGWTLIALVALAALLAGGWHYARASNAVALLDRADRMVAGSAGTRVALSGASYGKHPAQTLEVITPDAPAGGPRPVLVFFHGGGWHSGAPGEYHFVGRTFARAGYVVVLPGYRLGPDGTWPRMLEDGALALRWVNDHAAEHGGDPAQVLLMGHSAGAYSAVMLALERQWLGREGLPEGFIKGVVGLSGPYDFHPFTSDSARAAFSHAAEPKLTQPVNHVRSDAPPMLLVNGDADTTVRPRNTVALAKALTAAGQSTEPVILAGVDHADTAMKLAAPFNRDRRVLDPVLAFLKSTGSTSAHVKAVVR
jgi:acetyl esterase/lipase